MLRCLQRREEGRRLAQAGAEALRSATMAAIPAGRLASASVTRSLSRSLRVSSFRGLPQSATTPTAELSRLRLVKPSSINEFAGEDLR